VRVVLENAGTSIRKRLTTTSRRDGYKALLTALTGDDAERRDPSDYGKRAAGTRRRRLSDRAEVEHGGQGDGDMKYVVCNGDEGDPGAFMDRSVMEGDPHRVIEGMAIAAYAVGASKGFIYVRAEYPLAVSAADDGDARGAAAGAAGQQHLGHEVQLRRGDPAGRGAFVCGEETALLASIEGGAERRSRGRRIRRKRLWGKPTLINNVETYANIAPIIRNGGKWFANMGSEQEQGHQGVRSDGQDHQHGPDRSADGHQAAGDHFRRDRRRRSRRPQVQGGADGRAFGRLHSGEHAGHRWITTR
jgi:NADP-reducing hydrogenase subunit HndC